MKRVTREVFTDDEKVRWRITRRGKTTVMIERWVPRGGGIYIYAYTHANGGFKQ